MEMNIPQSLISNIKAKQKSKSAKELFLAQLENAGWETGINTVVYTRKTCRNMLFAYDSYFIVSEDINRRHYAYTQSNLKKYINMCDFTSNLKEIY